MRGAHGRCLDRIHDVEPVDSVTIGAAYPPYDYPTATCPCPRRATDGIKLPYWGVRDKRRTLFSQTPSFVLRFAQMAADGCGVLAVFSTSQPR